MNHNNPFKRAKLMMMAIQHIVATVVGSAQQQAEIAKLGPYVSRGKGQGKGRSAPHGANMAFIRKAHKARSAGKRRTHAYN